MNSGPATADTAKTFPTEPSPRPLAFCYLKGQQIQYLPRNEQTASLCRSAGLPCKQDFSLPTRSLLHSSSQSPSTGCVESHHCREKEGYLLLGSQRFSASVKQVFIYSSLIPKPQTSNSRRNPLPHPPHSHQDDHHE